LQGFLGFLNDNGALLANLNAGLAAQALICIYGNRLAILKLENIHRTNINAFFAASALVSIHSRIESHETIPPLSLK